MRLMGFNNACTRITNHHSVTYIPAPTHTPLMTCTTALDNKSTAILSDHSVGGRLRERLEALMERANNLNNVLLSIEGCEKNGSDCLNEWMME